MTLTKAFCVVLFSLVGLPLLDSGVRAAEITLLSGSNAEVTLIGVEGEFVTGDETKFAELAVAHPKAMVLFNSPGGDLATGIGIGKDIRLKGFLTYVPSGMICASACGLAWLGGVQRFMELDSKIGFHSAFNADDGQTSGPANAIVGSYLSQLGLSENAIIYVTEAAPTSMNWMTYEDAMKFGISVSVTKPAQQASQPEPSQAPAPSPAPTALPPSSPSSASQDMISLPGADIFGHDLPGMPLKNVTMAECENACQSDSRCLALTFNRKHSVCFMKNGGERVFKNSNADAAYKSALSPVLHISKITILEATDLPGDDYNQLDGVGFGVCSDSCEEDTRCRSFTYHAKSKTCWLKSEIPVSSASRRVISGVKE